MYFYIQFIYSTILPNYPHKFLTISKKSELRSQVCGDSTREYCEYYEKKNEKKMKKKDRECGLDVLQAS